MTTSQANSSIHVEAQAGPVPCRADDRDSTVPIVAARNRASAVAAFLKDKLAAGVVAVSELEATAQAAGLLASHQSIGDTKPFKRAKRALGIKSVRVGFGINGGWCWFLPPEPNAAVATPGGRLSTTEATYVDDDASPKSASTIAPTDPHDPKRPPPELHEYRRIPLDWINGVARLDRGRAPAGVLLHRWQVFVSDCEIFCQNWAGQAADLGWDAEAVFGCSKSQPLSYLQVAGLVWVLAGRRLIKLHRDWASIEDPANDSQHVFNRRRHINGQVILPWVLR
jgi:hypothetical protein